MVHTFKQMKLDLPDVIIGSCGFAAIQMPLWVQELNDLLLHLDGFYKFGIFLVTVLAIWARRKHYQNKKD